MTSVVAALKELFHFSFSIAQVQLHVSMIQWLSEAIASRCFSQSLEAYEWSDGWPTVFTNWGGNEPAFNPITRTCVIMNVTNGSWYTKTCDQPHTFICKYINGE